MYLQILPTHTAFLMRLSALRTKPAGEELLASRKLVSLK